MDEMKECPMCFKMVEWGEMIWLNGICTCPECYEKRRKQIDRPGVDLCECFEERK